ncbi:MAG: TIGR04255 family protein [Verrucomicrobia bacterium]|nr:TIGR04255 family protein [Verrucomicrobiota bacterium]
MHRKREALILPRSPLVFVLGAVQFDPVLAVEGYLPEIHESLRKNGFPKVRTRIIPHRIVKTEDSKLLAEVKKQWEFHDAANRTSILVDQDAVVVQTTAYSTYEHLHELFELALTTVADRLEVNEVLRCGLRYIDIVDCPPDGSIADWVQPELLGMAGFGGFKRQLGHSTTELSGPDGSSVRIRASLVPQGIILPPDLTPCDLAFPVTPVKQQSFVMLDFDHFSESHFPYERQTTLDHLAQLHDGVELAFRSSVTPHALEQWQQP